MTEFRLRTRTDQEMGPESTVMVDWFSGIGSTLQVRHSLTDDLEPGAAALDLMRLAASIYCADRVVRRPGTWTRSLSVELPVHDSKTWARVAAKLAQALAFLTGDEWRIEPFGDTDSESPARASDDPVDAVCLFSGGLDSFAGAVDLLAGGKKVCLVSHYEGGQAPRAQIELWQRLSRTFGEDRVVLRRVFLRPAPWSADQARPLPLERETSTRSRSLLFLASGLVVAAGYGPDVPLMVPENGFIGINVPLTEARNGSLSTRTTHPHFMTSLNVCIEQLGITNPVINPYRFMTKGELAAAGYAHASFLAGARGTLSCAHPEAPRYAKRPQGNCGYCFPCLIRRAGMHHVGLDRASDYAFDALHEDAALSGERGQDLRALIRSLSRTARPTDVLRNGPVPMEQVREYSGVYERGRAEILAWMRAGEPSPAVERQLPDR